MRYLKTMALAVLLIVWGLPLQAAQLKGLYEAEVEVADQGRAARARAMTEAMAAVILKVGGSASVLEQEVLKSAMADASRYVRQYRYRSEAIPSEQREAAKGGEGSSENHLLLWVSFDNDSIDNLLRRFGLSVWSAARPSTLAWLVVEDGSRRLMVGANDQGLVRDVVEAEAERRAIPIRLPLLDLTDQSRVRAIDVWGGFFDNIEAASKRYETQAILVGKLYSVGKLWEARWTLLYQGERHEWESTSSRVSEVVASGVGGTADYLSNYFASSSYLGLDQLALHIDQVNGMAAFRRINDYLLSLHGVTAVKLRQADAASASFLLEIEGGRETVLQAINMGDVLVEVEPPPQFESTPPLGMVPGASLAQVTPSADAVTSQQPEAEFAMPESPQQAAPSSESATGPENTMESEDTAGEVMPVAQPQAIPVEELFFRLLP